MKKRFRRLNHTIYLITKTNMEELTPEQIQELQSKVSELEEKAARANELEKALQEKEVALAKLSNKDMNFQRLRDKTEAELNELRAKADDKQKVILNELIDLTRERDEEKQRSYNEAKEEILMSLSGGDAELRKRIELAEKELAGEAVTAKELEDRYRKSYILAQGAAPRANPIFSGYSVSYKDPDTKVANFSESEQGKESIKSWFPQIADRIYKK